MLMKTMYVFTSGVTAGDDRYGDTGFMKIITGEEQSLI